MKKLRNNSHHASTLQVALSTGLISISAILLVIAAPTNTKKAPRHDPQGFQSQGSTDSVTALGNYPDTSISLSGDTTVTPDAVPTDTTSINVSTNTNFKGTFAANPTTGVITVTDAHPASAYTVAVTAFGPGGTTTKTFTLTVTSTPCGAGLTAGFSSAADVDASFAASVAIGDFNGDGIQDLAVANYGLDTVSIRLGDGLGGFNGSTEVSMGAHPISAAIGDFNGDGKQDLVVAHLDSGTLSIRLGDGLGGFSGSTEVSVGSGAFSVAIGDFNSDGKQDLAAGHYVSPTVSIRLGDGLGGFSGSTEVSVGSGAHSVAIGDFNGDGKQDLAVANALSNTVSIRLGDGLGGFSGSAEVSVGSSPLSVAIGDFNEDGKQDLAVANQSSNTVSIRLGDGSGGFSGSTEVSLSYPPSSVAIGDFNGDGEQDLAVASQRSDLLLGTVSIRLGDGLGGFTGSTEVSMGYEPNSIVIGDFNGDGKQDLAVANFGSNTVSIRLGQCIPPAAQALNLSTRMLVQTGDNVGIGGFIITGSAPKQVLLRGIGPSLTGSGLPDAMADPVMELHGPGGFTTIINDNWMDTQAAAILATGLAPTDNLESAILVTLNPGPYTAIVKGKDNTTGVALVELYDLDEAADSKLANISTRAFVNTGSNVVIAGFILGGNSGDDNIVVRGIGPSLAAFGVPSVLADPTLELRNSNGALLIANNDWQDDPVQAGIIAAAGLAPSNALESAIAATLSLGQYTAILAGANSTTGNGVVEVYDLGTGMPVPTPTAGGTATPTATATATPGGTPSPTPVGSPSPTPVASPTPGVDPCWPESFDGVTAPALPASWVATNPDPGDGTLWVTSTTSPDSAPNDAFIPDQDGISDKVLDRLGVTITGAAVMTFRNNFNTEMSGGIFWDGYVLEVSTPNISGGDFLDITDSQVGGSFVSGGYTGEIDGSASNPLAGRMAWSGSSGGYIDTVIDLGPNLVGQTVTFRFRMGSDEAVAAPGVRIDNVAFTNSSCP